MAFLSASLEEVEGVFESGQWSDSGAAGMRAMSSSGVTFSAMVSSVSVMVLM